MGMYTELICAFELKNDTPKEVLDILMFMLDEKEDHPELPNHPLFEEGSRWGFMLVCDSYYFDGTTHSQLKVDYLHGHDKPMYYLTVRSNFKNYENEIDNFIDWLKPYIVKDKENMFIGYKRYETENEPTLIYV